MIRTSRGMRRSLQWMVLVFALGVAGFDRPSNRTVAQPSDTKTTTADVAPMDDAPSDAASTSVANPEEADGDVVGAIVTISGEITDVTTESIKRRVAHAIDSGAKVIIFEMDTPGGYVTSALDICNFIKNLHDVKTVAWVNSSAYSAGSMISVACDEIVMTRASTLGDCGVILGGPTGPQAVPEQIRAKAESPVLEQFRDSAAKHGYDRLLCESMVVKEYEVYWVENIATGERRFVEADEKDDLLGKAKKTTSVLGLEVPLLAASKAEWKLVEHFPPDPVTGVEVPVSQPVVKKTELLTMSQSRAQAFGFSKGIVSNVDDLRQRYTLSNDIRRIEFTWSEVFTRWLTSMPVRMFLMVIVLLGAYVEFNTPGVGVPGLVALIALSVFLGAPFLTGLANVWEVVVIVAGLALIGLEVFVIPGFGVAGISGILLVLIGLLATFIPEEPGRFPIHWPSLMQGVDGLKQGVQTLAASMAISIAGMVALSRYLPRMPYLRTIVPANPTPSDVMASDPYHGMARVGDRGLVVGELRPAGKARFGRLLVDVVTEGEMLESGLEVEVVERHGNRVVVRRARA